MLQDDDMPVDDAPADEGDGAPRQSYNFAPGYHGVVYRADVPDRGAGTGAGATRRSADDGENADAATGGIAADVDAVAAVTEEEGHGHAAAEQASPPSPGQNEQQQQRQHDADKHEQQQQHYKLQAMKWGLVPFWTKRNPDYATMRKTINCRDDSLAGTGGMWASMKARKRCVVIAEGFYEW
jgi:hypothetical protein